MGIGGEVLFFIEFDKSFMPDSNLQNWKHCKIGFVVYFMSSTNSEKVLVEAFMPDFIFFNWKHNKYDLMYFIFSNLIHIIFHVLDVFVLQ